MSEDDFLWPPESFEQNDDPALADKLQRSMDIIFAQLRRLQTAADAAADSGGGSAHDILSTTHSDSTVAAAVNGDLLRRSAGAWERLGIGIAGQALIAVLGLPAWSNDGHSLLIDASNIDQGSLPAARYPHNLLSAPHSDSVAAAAVLGDLISAQGAAATDMDLYWLDGLPVDDLPSVLAAGTEVYWLDGLPSDSLETSGAVAWQRLPNSTTAGYVLTASAAGVDWQPALANAVGASVYRASSFSLSDRVATPVALSTVVTDDSSFWSSGTPSRLTIPAGKGGWYAIVGQASYLSLTGRKVFTRIYVNGTERASSGSDAKIVQAKALIKLTAADYVELYVYAEQNVAGDLETVVGGSASTFLELVRVG